MLVRRRRRDNRLWGLGAYKFVKVFRRRVPGTRRSLILAAYKEHSCGIAGRFVADVAVEGQSSVAMVMINEVIADG
jgi:hypothetical protein